MLEQVFRDEWGRVLASLVGFLGDIELAEALDYTIDRRLNVLFLADIGADEHRIGGARLFQLHGQSLARILVPA